MISTRLYSRQRLTIVLCGICVLLFVANLRAPGELPSQPSPLISSNAASGTSSLPSGSSFDSSSSPADSLSSPSLLSSSSSPSPSSSLSQNNPSLSPVCRGYPENADVIIVVKTGGTEAFQRIPAQLLTFLQCAQDDILIFSDLEQDIGGHHIYDSLDKVVEKTKKDNPDFDLYNTQKEYRLVGGQVSSLSSRARDAWILDKYKNIHTAQKAYQMRPNKSWYFFIDADTYIVWANFFQWLKQLNPAEKLYLGSRVNIGVPPFAHGGSGYLLSGAAMAELVGKDAVAVAARYDEYAIRACCGDQELARILFEKNINATNARPMINGDKPRSLPFGPTQWCQPLITMHHMSPEEINDMWQFEQQRALTQTLTIEDIYYAFVEPKITPFRDDWDNLSNDDVLKAPDNAEGKKRSWWGRDEPYDSFNACGKACKEDPRCFQFSYYEGACALSAAFKLGEKKLPKDGVTYKSGWIMEKIAKFKSEKSPCKGPLWEAD